MVQARQQARTCPDRPSGPLCDQARWARSSRGSVLLGKGHHAKSGVGLWRRRIPSLCQRSLSCTDERLLHVARARSMAEAVAGIDDLLAMPYGRVHCSR
jgi:hypothetical protein